MKLSTGTIDIPLEFDNGDVEHIYIRPYDGMFDKIRNFENSVKHRFEEIDFKKHIKNTDTNIDINNLNFNDIMKMSAEDIEKLSKTIETINDIDKEIEQQICDELDNIFETEISAKAFKYVNPLVMQDDGELYVVQVMKAIAEKIEKRSKKLENKYTKKYGIK